MKRYSLFDYDTKPWWGRFYFAGRADEEKPLVLLPLPIYWIAHLWRDIHIAYLGFKLRHSAKRSEL